MLLVGRCLTRLEIGDYVKDDDVVAVIETESFSFEYRAHEPGVITKVHFTSLFTASCDTRSQFHAQEGQTIYPGNPLVDVDLGAKPPQKE